MQADFVGTLGRKAGDARAALAALEADPKDRAPRDDLRRRLHAIGTAARLLHFDAAHAAVARAEELLARVTAAGDASHDELVEIGRVLDDLPVLAWEDVTEGRPPSTPAAPKVEAAVHTALVVGEDAIAMALSELADGAGFECERTTDSTYAATLAHEMNPDVVVIDGDLEGTDELIEAILERSDLAPIVVLGRFEDSAQEARFIALGVARTLKKPAAEDILRAACREVADQHRGQTVKIVLSDAKPEPEPEVPGADRAQARGRGAAADVRLDGRRVVVADDDPGVVWFIADLLRTTGCVVHEARDGQEALELAYRTAPHLILSDVLMPKLDGFQLARTLKRDVALRDTPLILLSWKEDMLQRVRELGAGAAGYLRKESDARAILARVREALWPRARIEARFRGRQEVRGRLDGLTVRSLLELACTMRPKSRISLRDASYSYEMEIRDGAPCRAMRTGADGSTLRGGRAFAAMLGMWAGRFIVSPSEEAVDAELLGTLRAQIAEPVASARAAGNLLSGARAMSVAKVVVDSEILSAYLEATPEPVRSLIDRVARGESPRQMLASGSVDPALFEQALVDVASRGAISEVRGMHGEDLLRPSIDATLRMESGEASSSAPAPASSSAPAPASSSAPAPASSSAPAPASSSAPAPASSSASSPAPALAPAPSEPIPLVIESEDANTPMASVVARTITAQPQKKSRWSALAMFGAVALVAMGARFASPTETGATAAAAAPMTPFNEQTVYGKDAGRETLPLPASPAGGGGQTASRETLPLPASPAGGGGQTASPSSASSPAVAAKPSAAPVVSAKPSAAPATAAKSPGASSASAAPAAAKEADVASSAALELQVPSASLLAP